LTGFAEMCYLALMNDTGGETPFISLIIPNHNGAQTIGKCLEAAFRPGYGNLEVIVVDDCSGDGSVGIIQQYPCKLIRLPEHSGASAARNEGARSAKGEALFFIDADCILGDDTLDIAARAFIENPGAVTGGTYTPLAHDRSFFSNFQSLFIHYSETKHAEPDYVATHAMLISKKLFDESGGFNEEFMPILEDVEFSHRLRRRGVRLRMEPSIQVGHIFNYDLRGSLKNAFRKSLYWTMYSIKNKDLLADSGTASVELKADVLSWCVCTILFTLFILTGNFVFLAALAIVCGTNMLVNRKFLALIFKATGPAYTAKAVLYYTALYPLPVALGGLVGALRST